MIQEYNRDCYTDDWKRTEPDHVVYLPRTENGSDGYADHFVVAETPGGTLLAIWTQSATEGTRDSRVVFSRSLDGGESWTGPRLLAGTEDGKGVPAMFGFPVMSPKGRIFLPVQQAQEHRRPGVSDHGRPGLSLFRRRRPQLDGWRCRNRVWANQLGPSRSQGPLQRHLLAGTGSGRIGAPPGDRHPCQQPRGLSSVRSQRLGGSQRRQSGSNAAFREHRPVTRTQGPDHPLAAR